MQECIWNYHVKLAEAYQLPNLLASEILKAHLDHLLKAHLQKMSQYKNHCDKSILLSKSMAMVVRCSSSRPNSNEIFRQSRSSPIISSRKLQLYAESSVKNLLPRSMAKISKHLNEVRVLLKSEKVTYLPPKGNRLSFDLHRNVEYLFAHQGKEPCKFPVVAFVMANALMLTLPLEALAETCEASTSPFNMPILLGVALTGATVGGLLARQRKGELAKLNDQLRQINAALRKQAKIESYAPSLSYAPVGTRIPEDEVIVDSRKHDLISRLKTGKNFLRTQDPGKAYEEFKAALELAQILKDPIEEKKAARGLGASLQRLGKYKDAIKYHSLVLEISDREGEDSGNTEAYGAIADCYTELGDLEQAGKFYDKYILRLED